MVPLLILDVLGFFVSGIWLAVLGEWWTIGFGLLLLLVSTPALTLMLIPAMLFDSPAARYTKEGNAFGMLCFTALSDLYSLGVITLWYIGVLFFFVEGATSSSLIPRMIWSYGIATGPLGYMAYKEQQLGGSDIGSIFTTFLADLAYAVVMFMAIFSPVTLLQGIKVFAGFMLVGLVIKMTIVYLSRD